MSVRPIMVRIGNALNTLPVATAAGLALVDWITPQHVFGGEVGNFIGGRNRGRLPFIQYKCDGWNFEQESRQGGTVRCIAHLVVHVGGRNPLAAGDLATAIMQAAIAAIGDESVDNFTAASRQLTISELKQGPWGHEMQGTMELEFSYNDGEFAITA